MENSARFGVGVEDIVIVPLVAVAYALRKILRALFKILVHIIDWLFPLLLQLMRFPLFTLRIVGDALAALARGIVRFLPVGGDKRTAWRDAVSRTWGWVRGKLSYRAFEHALHHMFESGMAWVFRKCRALSPGGAVLVLAGAVLWLPISFGAATWLHTMLIAKALSLPAWMQLLHPVATIIAKSKLLVLPVYPAAWPQAKQHPAMQALIRCWRTLATLTLVRKVGFRYGKIERGGAAVAKAMARGAASLGVTQFVGDAMAGFNAAAYRAGRAARAGLGHALEFGERLPLFGAILRRYEGHYDAVNRMPAAPLSARTHDFFARWSTKFTVAYYENKEREDAAKAQAAAPVASA
jgi:hypothetical protein